MAVYDCFTFFNEYDLLQVRLMEHSPFVDQFVIAQGSHTFSGKPNPHRLDLTEQRFAPFASKITLINVSLKPAPCNAWENEYRQRDALLEAVAWSDDDVLLLSDLDEIVSRNSWPAVLRRLRTDPVLSIRMGVFYYFINLRADREISVAKMATGRACRSAGVTSQELRVSDAPDTEDICGWHFSYLGDEEFIRNKIQSFSHQEFNRREITDSGQIQRALRRQRDLFGRRIGYGWVPFDESWPLAMVQDAAWQRYVCPKRSRLLQMYDDVCAGTSRLCAKGMSRSRRLIGAVMGRRSHQC
ncbi:MAG: hypothetical protein AB7I48_03620 [Planctomycetaceae bacterium]